MFTAFARVGGKARPPAKQPKPLPALAAGSVSHPGPEHPAQLSRCGWQGARRGHPGHTPALAMPGKAARDKTDSTDMQREVGPVWRRQRVRNTCNVTASPADPACPGRRRCPSPRPERHLPARRRRGGGEPAYLARPGRRGPGFPAPAGSGAVFTVAGAGLRSVCDRGYLIHYLPDGSLGKCSAGPRAVRSAAVRKRPPWFKREGGGRGWGRGGRSAGLGGAGGDTRRALAAERTRSRGQAPAKPLARGRTAPPTALQPPAGPGRPRRLGPGRRVPRGPAQPPRASCGSPARTAVAAPRARTA